MRDRDDQRHEPDAEAEAGERGEGGHEQDHQDEFAALGADRFQGAELLQVLEDEAVEGLARDRQTDDEADHGHQEDVGTEAGAVDIEVGDVGLELLLRHRSVAKRRHLLLDAGHRRCVLRPHQQVGDREARGRDVLDGATVGGVPGGLIYDTFSSYA